MCSALRQFGRLTAGGLRALSLFRTLSRVEGTKQRFKICFAIYGRPLSILLFRISVRPGTQPDGLVVHVILGFSRGLHGLTCAGWIDPRLGNRSKADKCPLFVIIWNCYNHNTAKEHSVNNLRQKTKDRKHQSSSPLPSKNFSYFCLFSF